MIPLVSMPGFWLWIGDKNVMEENEGCNFVTCVNSTSNHIHFLHKRWRIAYSIYFSGLRTGFPFWRSFGESGPCITVNVKFEF